MYWYVPFEDNDTIFMLEMLDYLIKKMLDYVLKVGHRE